MARCHEAPRYIRTQLRAHKTMTMSRGKTRRTSRHLTLHVSWPLSILRSRCWYEYCQGGLTSQGSMPTVAIPNGQIHTREGIIPTAGVAKWSTVAGCRLVFRCRPVIIHVGPPGRRYSAWGQPGNSSLGEWWTGICTEYYLMPGTSHVRSTPRTSMSLLALAQGPPVR